MAMRTGFQLHDMVARASRRKRYELCTVTFDWNYQPAMFKCHTLSVRSVCLTQTLLMEVEP